MAETEPVTIAPDVLLEGPRGRHLCLAVAHRLHRPVWRAWLESAWHAGDAAARAGLITALAGVNTGALQTWGSVESFAGALGDSVDRAMYWEQPDDEDNVAAMPDVRAALRPIAQAISAAPGTSWWASPIDLENQRLTSLHDPGQAAEEPDLSAAAAKLARWRQHTIADDQRARREGPADASASYSGFWWSTPIGTGLLCTTRALPTAGAAQLVWEEDGFGQDAATVWKTKVSGQPRIYEVSSPNSWVELVRRYPLDVTWGRRHDWYRVAGRADIWLIPDWAAVSHDWDAVHLSVTGYLTAATRMLPINENAATMVAGWNPDETFWLSDLLTVADTPAEKWIKITRSGDADDQWREHSTAPNRLARRNATRDSSSG